MSMRTERQQDEEHGPQDGSGPVRALMSDDDDFHPDLRRVARWLPRAAVSPRTLAPVRLLAGLQAKWPTKGVEVRSVAATSVRVHRPPAMVEPAPALLWIHGGGYVMGTAVQDDAVCRHFARELGILVIAVDYRLAPEHPFPTPLHDCYDALTWLAGQPDVDPNRIAVGGASAGGGLAAALALLAHQRGEVSLAFQLLAYPMLDDRTTTRVGVDERHFRMWNTKANRFGWQSYLGRPPGGTQVDELAAPARLADLAPLPPAWVGVGTFDLFHDEDVAYADRLVAAGVKCELDEVKGGFHGFDLVLPKAGVSRHFRSAQVAALADALR
jgi:acetyl esterase/lipase